MIPGVCAAVDEGGARGKGAVVESCGDGYVFLSLSGAVEDMVYSVRYLYFCCIRGVVGRRRPAWGVGDTFRSHMFWNYFCLSC